MPHHYHTQQHDHPPVENQQIHRDMHHNRHGLSYYDPRFNDPAFLQSLGKITLGTALSFFGGALSVDAAQRGNPWQRLGGIALLLGGVGLLVLGMRDQLTHD